METSTQDVGQFRQTLKLSPNYFEISIANDPFGTFDFFWFSQEARERCVSHLQSGRATPYKRPFNDWAENRIQGMLTWDDPLWKPMLEWYCWASGVNTNPKRAIEYAIRLAQGSPRLVPDISKAVCPAAQYHYWSLPNIKWFLERCFDELNRLFGSSGCDRLESAPTFPLVFNTVKRAVTLLVLVRDTTWIERISKAHSLLEPDNLHWRPNGCSIFDRPTAIAVLAHSIKILTEAKNKEHSSLHQGLSERIKAYSKKDPDLESDAFYPSECKPGEDVPLIVRLIFKNTNNPELWRHYMKSKMAYVRLNGFLSIKHWENNKNLGSHELAHIGTLDENGIGWLQRFEEIGPCVFEAKFKLQPSLGMNRFYLYMLREDSHYSVFEEGKETGYVYCT